MASYTGDKNPQGKPHGRGTYRWADGTSYQGTFKNGAMDGEGVYTWPNGNKYDGEFRGGVRTGKGLLVYREGDVYEGDIVNGKIEGHGTYWFSNGDRSQGQWVNDHLSGKGIQYVNGSFYDGQFQNGTIKSGVWFSKEGHLFEGTFMNGSPGNGTYTWPTGRSKEIKGGAVGNLLSNYSPRWGGPAPSFLNAKPSNSPILSGAQKNPPSIPAPHLSYGGGGGGSEGRSAAPSTSQPTKPSAPAHKPAPPRERSRSPPSRNEPAHAPKPPSAPSAPKPPSAPSAPSAPKPPAAPSAPKPPPPPPSAPKPPSPPHSHSRSPPKHHSSSSSEDDLDKEFGKFNLDVDVDFKSKGKGKGSKSSSSSEEEVHKPSFDRPVSTSFSMDELDEFLSPAETILPPMTVTLKPLKPSVDTSTDDILSSFENELSGMLDDTPSAFGLNSHADAEISIEEEFDLSPPISSQPINSPYDDIEEMLGAISDFKMDLDVEKASSSSDSELDEFFQDK